MLKSKSSVLICSSLWHMFRHQQQLTAVRTFSQIIKNQDIPTSVISPPREEEELKHLERANKGDPCANKVTVVGAGQVGVAIAFSLLTQNVTSNVTLIDNRKNIVNGEVLDIDRASVFLPEGSHIIGSTKYEASKDSKICILAAAATRQGDESAEKMIRKNSDCFKEIVPLIAEYSPLATYLVVSHPVDVMAFITWRLSGLPASRVIGLGTAVDSAQFQTLIARRLGLAINDIHGWIIGEQGYRSIPVWSGVNAAGVRLRDLLPDVGTERDKERWADMHKDSVSNGQEIINLKGYSSWGPALSITAICKAVLGNSHHVYSVSTLVKGQLGVEKEVFLSLPCVIFENGIQKIVNQDLSDKEKELFQNSAETVQNIQTKITI